MEVNVNFRAGRRGYTIVEEDSYLPSSPDEEISKPEEYVSEAEVPPAESEAGPESEVDSVTTSSPVQHSEGDESSNGEKSDSVSEDAKTAKTQSADPDASYSVGESSTDSTVDTSVQETVTSPSVESIGSEGGKTVDASVSADETSTVTSEMSKYKDIILPEQLETAALKVARQLLTEMTKSKASAGDNTQAPTAAKLTASPSAKKADGGKADGNSKSTANLDDPDLPWTIILYNETSGTITTKKVVPSKQKPFFYNPDKIKSLAKGEETTSDTTKVEAAEGKSAASEGDTEAAEEPTAEGEETTSEAPAGEEGGAGEAEEEENEGGEETEGEGGEEGEGEDNEGGEEGEEEGEEEGGEETEGEGGEEGEGEDNEGEDNE